MSKLIELTNKGLVISSKEEIRTHLKELISEAYGNDINFNVNYPDGIILEGLSTIIRDTFESIEGLYNSFNLRNASGVVLDTLSSLVNIYRRGKTNASMNKTIILTVNKNENGEAIKTTYNITGIVLKDNNNNIWKYSSNIIAQEITKDTSYSLDFICETLGIVDYPTSLTLMYPTDVTGIDFSEVIYNKFIQGDEEESDIYLRNRVILSPIHNSVSIKEQLIKKIMESPYVKSVKVYNNDTSSELTLKMKNGDKNLLLPASNIAIIIQYIEERISTGEGLLKEVKDSIGEIIRDYKGLCSITFNPDIPNQYTYSYPDIYNDKISHSIVYLEAQKKKGVIIDITIIPGENYNVEGTEKLIKDNTINYLSSLGIGEDLIQGNLIKYLYDYSDNQYTISSLSIEGNISNDEYFPTEEEIEIIKIDETETKNTILAINVTVQGG